MRNEPLPSAQCEANRPISKFRARTDLPSDLWSIQRLASGYDVLEPWRPIYDRINESYLYICRYRYLKKGSFQCVLVDSAS